MFCSNCGKQIPDNTRFCNYCGTEQQIVVEAAPAPKTTENQQSVADTQTQAPKKKPNKKASILIVLAVVICASLFGKFVIAPLMTPDSGKGNGAGDQGGQSEQTPGNGSGGSSSGSNNSAYDAIFDGSYIVHFQFFANMEMKNFAMKNNNGIIVCADYGYKDDVVKQWVETMYIPVSGYSDAQKSEVENTMRAQFASLDALKCCAVTYKMGTSYFTITCTYSNVDQSSNYAELYKAGILQTNTFISMSATETTLLGQGFVKK